MSIISSKTIKAAAQVVQNLIRQVNHASYYTHRAGEKHSSANKAHAPGPAPALTHCIRMGAAQSCKTAGVSTSDNMAQGPDFPWQQKSTSRRRSPQQPLSFLRTFWLRAGVCCLTVTTHRYLIHSISMYNSRSQSHIQSISYQSYLYQYLDSHVFGVATYYPVIP